MTTKRKPALMLTALLALALCLMLAVCVLTACNDSGSTGQELPGGDQAGSETPDEEDSGAEDTDAPSDTPQGDAEEPNDEESQDPDDEEKNPTDEEPATPEMTEDELYQENIELLKIAIVDGYSIDFGDFADASLEIAENQKLIINEAAGEIYFFGKRIDIFGGSDNLCFVSTFHKNILSETQKNLNFILKHDPNCFDISFEFWKSIHVNLSEEMYKEFEQFLCSQSYDNDGETVTFGADARVLHISKYISGDAYGGKYIQFLVIDGDKIYTARLENAMPPSCYDGDIRQIMGYSNNVFKVTDVKDFKEFNYEDDKEQM